MGKMFYKDFWHFRNAVSKKYKNETRERHFPYTTSLKTIYDFDIEHNEGDSVCSKLYFDMLENEPLTENVAKHIIIKYKNEILNYYKENNINKEKPFFINKEINELKREKKKVPGVYFIYDDLGDLIYIGKSKTDVIERSMQSSKLHHGRQIQYMFLGRLSDVNFMECYLISKYKPIKNKDMVEDDELSFVLEEPPRTKKINVFGGEVKEEEKIKVRKEV